MKRVVYGIVGYILVNLQRMKRLHAPVILMDSFGNQVFFLISFYILYFFLRM